MGGMAEDLDDDLDEAEDVDGEDGEGGSRKGGKKTLFIIIGAVLVLVIGGLAGAWFTGLLDPVVAMFTGEHAEETAMEGEDGHSINGNVVYFELPEIIVNLNTGGRQKTYLKIQVSLELQKAEDIPRVEGVMDRIMDTFNVYLRELRIDDLKGSAGIYRVHEELLMRVSAVVAPVQVNDLLIKEMLVQ
jgi:flagellar FliL protein